MAEAAMDSSRVDQIGETQLFDVALTLEPAMRYYVEYDVVVNGQETIDRVIYYFAFVSHSC